jgi:xanthine dehydrogenase small subunit
MLQYLRENLHCAGTKEGCAEDDGGACTVVIGALNDAGTLSLKAVNACKSRPTLPLRDPLTVIPQDLPCTAG